jgi:hypothetical protein
VRIVTILPATFAIVATMALATPFQANAAIQCVTYARDVSGLNLKGDAWKWWEAAAGVYDRGNRPREGAVLVFKRQGKMAHGHVSVVRHMKNSRELLVDHANWAPNRSAGRGKVTHSVPVIDVSPNNDWSQVRVFYRPIGELGTKVYLTQGFVYRPGTSGTGRSMLSQPASHSSGHADASPTTDSLVQNVALSDTAAPAMMRIETTPTQPKSEPPAAAPVKSPEPAAIVATPAKTVEPAPVVAAPAKTVAPAPVVAAAPAVKSVEPNQVVASPAPVAQPGPVRPADPGRVDVSRWAEQA